MLAVAARSAIQTLLQRLHLLVGVVCPGRSPRRQLRPFRTVAADRTRVVSRIHGFAPTAQRPFRTIKTSAAIARRLQQSLVAAIYAHIARNAFVFALEARSSSIFASQASLHGGPRPLRTERPTRTASERHQII
jgi:hypothetical protein